MKNTFEFICLKINWLELADQKKALAVQVKSTRGRKSSKLFDLLKFIERLQDAATDEYGVPMAEVHPILTKSNLITSFKKNLN